MNDLIIILTTMPDDDRAAAMARTLVDERLAACVNVHAAMASTYRWQGQIEIGAERQLVIKTTRARRAALEARLRALHPYELPEIVFVAATATADYEQWLRDSTA